MLIKSKEFLKLKKKVNKLITEDIVDVILFGSSVKEKLHPRDIDIAIIFRSSIKREILKKFQNNLGEKYHTSSLVVDQLFTKPHSLGKTLLYEGISLITDKKISDNFDLKPFSLYTYDLTREKPTKKVRFVYTLKGRSNNKGLIEEFKGRYISPSSFIIPVEKDEEMLEIFKKWDIKFYRKKLLLMS